MHAPPTPLAGADRGRRPQTLALYGSLAATALPGYPIRPAGGGRAALTLMAEETPSLVIWI